MTKTYYSFIVDLSALFRHQRGGEMWLENGPRELARPCCFTPAELPFLDGFVGAIGANRTESSLGLGVSESCQNCSFD